MQHAITISGEAFRLRPVAMGDAAFIVALRTNPRLGRFIHRTSPHVSDQERWLEEYFQRPGDYYFLVERLATGGAEGTISIYEVDAAARRAEWGRWVLREGSLAAPESVLLVYRVAFDVLGLEMVYSRTLAANERVVSFHVSCGLVTHARLANYVTLDGQDYDAIEHHMTREMWPAREPALARSAAAAAKIVRRSNP